MHALHEHGTIQLATPSLLPGAVTPSEATLVQESPTFDEMSRLWQSLAMPLRTTSQYRVSVIFLTPDKLPVGAPQVTAYNLGSGPSAPVKDASLPRLLATRRTVTFVAPGPVTRAFHQVPASTAPAPPAVTGQTVELAGIMLADTDHLILISYSPSGVATEADVTATWKVAITPPYTTPPANGVPILLPAPGGGGAPKPGRYGVTVSRPSMPGWRAQPVPLNVAPWINPSGGPLLNAVAGLYSLNVRGVSASVATLRVGTVQLKRLPDGSAPAAGEWQRSGNNITFRVLGGTPAGNHQIGLRVSGVSRPDRARGRRPLAAVDGRARRDRPRGGMVGAAGCLRPQSSIEPRARLSRRCRGSGASDAVARRAVLELAGRLSARAGIRASAMAGRLAGGRARGGLAQLEPVGRGR